MLNFLKNSLQKQIALVVYLIVNSFFVLKYGDRQEYIPTYLAIVIYNIVVKAIIFGIEKCANAVNSLHRNNHYFLAIATIVFALFMIINFTIDAESLNTDRWSAMETTVKGILSGEYPYYLKDHLGQTSSNLPGLFYIGLPFYLLGDIGLLQPFVFLSGCFLLYKSKLEVSIKLMTLALFVMSPAYLWEIFAKSDLLSNILLLVYFLLIWHKKHKEDYFKSLPKLAFWCAFLFFTRGVVIIPLTYFLFSDFLKQSISRKLKFLCYCLLFLIVISMPILINLPELAVIKAHNPFNHQTRFTPFWVQVLFVLLPLLTFVKTKDIYQVLYRCFVSFTLLLFLSFIIEILDENFYDALYKSYFDISYLTMILPFAILVITFRKDVTLASSHHQ